MKGVATTQKEISLPEYRSPLGLFFLNDPAST
jgi:hypothetical protein